MPRDEGFVERIVHNVESRIEQWREEDAARKAEAERHRDALREEAVERERLLAQSIGEEESRGVSPKQAAMEHGAVFVVHSEEAGRALEELADEGARLVQVVPGRGNDGDAGVRGGWLLFDRS